MRPRWGLVVLLLASCIQERLTECPDNLACPQGLVCDVAHHTCVTQEQLDACGSQLDGARCMTSSVPDGSCQQGVCLPRGCGNGFVEPGEVCDDSNHVSGDGCSADCLSNEVCGNGVVDLGEECDDGGTLSHDGCDSVCRTETLEWQQLTPQARNDFTEFAAAFDEARNKLVTFGGMHPEILDYTFEWDGKAWIRRLTRIQPTARQGAAMAYDAAHHQMVLFGGNDGSQELGDTWIWDGTSWTEVTPATGPTARHEHTMVYDSARRRVVLFGGFDGTTAFNDTWEWDGTSWAQITTATAPPARYMHVMAYDPEHGATVMYGGKQGVTMYTDTWLWNGTTWTMSPTGTNPGVRVDAAMTYGPTWHALVLTGGGTSDSWTWNGTTWQLYATSLLLGRAGHAMFYDAGRDKVVAVSGGPDYVAYCEAGSTWFQPSDAGLAGPRSNPAMTFDDTNGAVSMYGGSGTSELWAYDDDWSQQLAFGPFASSATAYDPVRKRLVLYHTSNSTTAGLSELTTDWATPWTTASSGVGPTERSGASLVYDPDQRGIVMFGGKVADATPTSEMWLWNGAWSAVATTGTPPPGRDLALLTHDPRRHKLVLFGGRDSIGALRDTWELDEATMTWTAIATATSPAARYASAFSFDTRRNTTVLYAGSNGSLKDLWEWDGTSWSRLPTDPIINPGFVGDGAMAYDPIRGLFLLVYGQGIWQLQWTRHVADDLCTAAADLDGDGLAGCADADCYARCTPACPPATSCDPALSRCGDGVCDPTETCLLCPADCTCANRCGDFICGPAETLASCPGDCTP